MKKFSQLMLVMALVCSFPLISEASAKVIAAKFHSDSCGSCKVMGPAVTAAANELSGGDVLFVKFDKTDENTLNQSQMLAEALGIEEAYNANAKTGFVLLIDAETKEVRGKLNKTHSAEDMIAAIDTVLAGGMAMPEAVAAPVKMEKKGSGY